MAEVTAQAETLKSLEQQLQTVQTDLNDFLSGIPNIPHSTVPMSVTFIDFDRDAPPQTITANAKTVSERSLISFDIRAEDLVPILGLFGDAEKMTINFPQGNEPQWTAKIDGSRKAASSFAQCIAALGITPYSSIAPTQPAF